MRGRIDRLPPAPERAPPTMDLLEYQGKQLFAKHGVAVPSGEVAATVEDAVAAAERIGYPCAIKAQVLIGGRGKAGGIKIAQDAEEARAYADAILGMDIVGPHGEGPFRVDQVWIEGGSEIAAEYYASVILDRGEKKLLAMVSAKGGMDIEAVAAEDPEALVRRHIDLVYHAALRQVGGDAHRAEDVTQTVFADLARLTRTLSSEVMLGGWLHRHTCYVAATMLRGERRRQSRERHCSEGSTTPATPA